MSNEASTPRLTPADVVFAEATPRQRVLAWQLNGASWAPPLTLDQYVGREKVLSRTALSANGGTKYYVLHHKDDADTIVSACEVTAKKALVADSSGSRVVDAYGLASVYTAPQFRERGMASHMLREVQQAVDAAGTECGALYSDIGREYYARLGWEDFRTPQVKFSLQKGFEPPPTVGSDVLFLAESDVAELCEKDVDALTRRFRRLAEARDGKTYVAFLPSFVQSSWHFARDAYVAGVMARREVRHRGARTSDGRSWLYWDHDLREKKLKVLRVVTSGEDQPHKRAADVRGLLQAALAEAHDWGLPALLVWSPDKEVVTAATDIWRDAGENLQVLFEERQDGSIPSLRWKGGEDVGKVVWEANEYFSWC
jgi:GNAT superfamily N-acetyltransferase